MSKYRNRSFSPKPSYFNNSPVCPDEKSVECPTVFDLSQLQYLLLIAFKLYSGVIIRKESEKVKLPSLDEYVASSINILLCTFFSLNVNIFIHSSYSSVYHTTRLIALPDLATHFLFKAICDEFLRQRKKILF